MLNFWKLAAISAVLAGAFVVATEGPSASQSAGEAPALRGTAAADGIRCDVVGGWPFFDQRCAPAATARKVRTVGLDRGLDAAGPFRVTEIARPIVR